MGFPAPPEYRLRQWDDAACEATVIAQLLIMGGKLQFPFDTAQLDRQLGRQPHHPIYTANGIRLLVGQLPTLSMTAYGPESPLEYSNPTKVRQALAKAGYNDNQIEGYLNSRDFALNRQRNEDFAQLEKELGRKNRKVIDTQSGRYAEGLLRKGHVLVVSLAVDAANSHAVLLIPEINSSSVTLYDPCKSPTRASVSQMLSHPRLDLSRDGYVAYAYS